MKSSTSVCAGIVTYNPDIELLKRNIDSIESQVKQIVVFDNGSTNISSLKVLLETYKTVVLLEGIENKGVACALNQLCEWANNNNYSWILTLDQDSVSPQNLVEKLSKYAKQSVAVVAPNIVYKNNEKYAIHPNKKYEKVNWVITSASLTNVEVWKKLDGFDEWLFIDGVDYDFGIRANRKGYKVIRTYEVDLLHELGNLRCFRVFGKTLYITNHSPLRKYYMTRNEIYLRHKLHRGKPILTISNYVFKTIFFEKEKRKKVISIIHGVCDGLKSIKGLKDE